MGSFRGGHLSESHLCEYIFHATQMLMTTDKETPQLSINHLRSDLNLPVILNQLLLTYIIEVSDMLPGECRNDHVGDLWQKLFTMRRWLFSLLLYEGGEKPRSG